MLILQAERLYLRDFVETDWPAVHAFRSDPDVARYMDFEPENEDESRHWLDEIIFHNQIRPRRVYNLAIVLRAREMVIGWIGIGPPSRPAPAGVYDFGYCLNQSYWGQGYTTEAVKVLLTFTFTKLGARRVFAECDPANRASARVMEKAGLHFEGEFAGEDCPGELVTCLRYALHDSQWQAGQQGETAE